MSVLLDKEPKNKKSQLLGTSTNHVDSLYDSSYKGGDFVKKVFNGNYNSGITERVSHNSRFFKNVDSRLENQF